MSFFKKKQQSNEMPSAKPKVSRRKRSETLNLALTAEEKALINDGAAKAAMSRTDFILKAVRNEKITVITGLPKVYRALYMSSNNMNQIAKRINSHNDVCAGEIIDTLQDCRDAYGRLMRFVDRWEIRISEMEENDDCQNESEQESQGSD